MPVKWVESLLALQTVDLRIRELEQRVALLPQEMNRLKAKRDEAVARVNAVADKGRKIDLERKSAESEIAKLNAENEKLRQQSAMVRKNSEYQAMLNTIAMNKKYIGDLETRVLGLMDDFEAARREYRKVKLESEIEVKGAREEFDELVAFSKDVKKEIASLTASRPELARAIDSATLSRYEALLRGKNGGAPLVPIENGICGHCHLRITPQAMNGIQKGAVTCCDNCMHLIYEAE